MTPEDAHRSLFRRRFSSEWVGLALAIVAVVGMILAFSKASDGPADPNSHSQGEMAAYGKAMVVVYLGYPSMAFALLASAVGLGFLIEQLRRRLNVAIPVITLVLCGVSFCLFAALVGWR